MKGVILASDTHCIQGSCYDPSPNAQMAERLEWHIFRVNFLTESRRHNLLGVTVAASLAISTSPANLSSLRKGPLVHMGPCRATCNHRYFFLRLWRQKTFLYRARKKAQQKRQHQTKAAVMESPVKHAKYTVR